MIPRGRLDIGWRDLVAGAAACARPGDREAVQRRVEALWSPQPDALACLSVRSALDLLLAATDYPKGSEILVTAVTIRDMIRVIEHRGLVPVPVDLDMRTLAPKPESLRAVTGPRTKAILAAHLFGARMPLDALAAFARERGLLLIEDVAQSFTGLEYRGHSDVDASLFSFGPIKTATALGGALVRVRDPELLARMRAAQRAQPVQSRRRFFERVVRFAAVHLALHRLPFTLLCAWCRWTGRDHDHVVSHSIRGFSGPDFFANIRQQPSLPLLALLWRRLVRHDGARVAGRIAAAQSVLRMVPEMPRPAETASNHSYWTFPVLAAAPDDFVRGLWARGFDATRGQWSLYAVPAPEGRQPAAEVEDVMSRIVYVPVYPEVSRADLARLADALSGGGGVPPDIARPAPTHARIGAAG
jgi:dTDP-4-amino-4,6-dideoxygalactose transaminase